MTDFEILQAEAARATQESADILNRHFGLDDEPIRFTLYKISAQMHETNKLLKSLQWAAIAALAIWIARSFF